MILCVLLSVVFHYLSFRYVNNENTEMISADLNVFALQKWRSTGEEET